MCTLFSSRHSAKSLSLIGLISTIVGLSSIQSAWAEPFDGRIENYSSQLEQYQQSLQTTQDAEKSAEGQLIKLSKSKISDKATEQKIQVLKTAIAQDQAAEQTDKTGILNLTEWLKLYQDKQQAVLYNRNVHAYNTAPALSTGTGWINPVTNVFTPKPTITASNAAPPNYTPSKRWGTTDYHQLWGAPADGDYGPQPTSPFDGWTSIPIGHSR